MANIKEVFDKDGNRSYKVTVSCGRRKDGRQKLKSKTFHPDPKKSERWNQKALQKFVFEFEQKCETGEVEAERMTFEEFAEKWLDEYAEKELERTTIERYRNGLKNTVYPRIGHMKLSAIKASTIQALVNDMREAVGHLLRRVSKNDKDYNIECYVCGCCRRAYQAEPMRSQESQA